MPNLINVIQDTSELTRRGFVTNYPHFRHWRGEAGAEGLKPKPLNVYVHLPYCLQRCAYCHFKTTTLRTTQMAEIDRYVNALCREIELASARFHLRDRQTISVYFGGGTPTLLSGENIDRIMETLRRNLTLDDIEINFEAEPVSLNRRKADILKRHGVNRINLGIQSFCDDIVFRTGRRDTEKQALEAIEIALSTGAVVNIDLISGLVGETPETWAYSVRRALETGAPSITVYKLEVYANTAYYADLRRQNITLPSDDEELEFARYAIDQLYAAGYEPVNFFTFTRDGGSVQRHITTKWQGTDVYAFGSSAFGTLGNWAYQNALEFDRYAEMIEQGELPIYRGYVYSALELMTRDVILGLKLVRFDRRAFRARHGLDVMRLCGPAIRKLEDEGFLTVDDDALVLSRKGILYGDYVGRILALALESLANWQGEAPSLSEMPAGPFLGSAPHQLTVPAATVVPPPNPAP
jgi:oxygen-independent coproporphyrinogen III oxidase